MVQVGILVAGCTDYRDSLADGIGYSPAEQGKPWHTASLAKGLLRVLQRPRESLALLLKALARHFVQKYMRKSNNSKRQGLKDR